MITSKHELLMLSGDIDLINGKRGPFYTLLESFAPNFSKITIICTSAPETKNVTFFSNVHIYSFGNNFIGMLRCISLAINLFKQSGPPSLVLSHDFGIFRNGLIAFLLTFFFRANVVSEILHVDGYPITISFKEKIQRFATKIYIRFAKYWVKAFRIINGVEIKQLLVKLGVPPEKMILSYAFFIDFKYFYPIPNFPKKWDLIFCGRLAGNKGIGIILKTIALLKKEGRPVSLLIRGTGPLQTSIESEIELLGIKEQVCFKEWVKDSQELADCYRSSKILICASTCEGGPRVTLEAMACGVPVISTPVGIMSEIATHGKNSLIFRWDTNELAGHIIQLLDNSPLREEIIKGGSKTVLRFEKERIIKEYAQNYLELINKIEGQIKRPNE